MINFVRYAGMILLLTVTAVFILKIKLVIPISYLSLMLIFLLGGICVVWANFRDKSEDKKK